MPKVRTWTFTQQRAAIDKNITRQTQTKKIPSFSKKNGKEIKGRTKNISLRTEARTKAGFLVD